jgi:hypothetical protein
LRGELPLWKAFREQIAQIDNGAGGSRAPWTGSPEG